MAFGVDRVDDKRFNQPVRVALGGPGKIRVVTSTREAAECLLYRWPKERGRNHYAALQTCMDVLYGPRKPNAAMQAFRAAAEEVDILVG